MNVVLLQDAQNSFNARCNLGFIGNRAVLRQQVFQHVAGNNGVAFDLADQILPDDQMLHEARQLLIQRTHLDFGFVRHHSKSKSEVKERRNVYC